MYTTNDQRLANYNDACQKQDLSDRYDAYSSEPASPNQITMKCDCGKRENWVNAREIFFGQHYGLIKLRKPMDHGDSVTFDSMWGIVEVWEGKATLYINCFRHHKRPIEKIKFVDYD